MNLYHVDIGCQGYDAYDGAVIAANDDRQAIELMLALQPNDRNETVTCELIGKAAENITSGIVLSSYNAGRE